MHVVIQVCGQARWRTLNILPAVKIKNREPCNCTIRMYLMATAIYLLYVCYCFVPAADCVRGWCCIIPLAMIKQFSITQLIAERKMYNWIFVGCLSRVNTVCCSSNWPSPCGHVNSKPKKKKEIFILHNKSWSREKSIDQRVLFPTGVSSCPLS